MITAEHTSRLSQRAQRTTLPPISWLMAKTLENPSMISLAAGFVDQQSLPAEMINDLVGKLFSCDRTCRKALQYGSTNGLQTLRSLLATRFEEQGLTAPVDPDCVVLTSGSQQLLFLVTDVLVDAGDIVLVEDPTYFVYMGVLESMGARILGVATDDEGIIPEALEERFEELKRAGELHRVKMLYLMTYFQNPKGTSHSWKRREQVWEIVQRYSTPEDFIYILEDAAYYELRFEGEDIPFMKTLDVDNERVILAMTFSKAFAPGLRLGYGHLPAELVGPVCNQKGNHDFGSGNLSQNIALLALETGYFEEQGKRLRARYAHKRDVMLEVLHEHLPREAKFLEPKGGLYVWTMLPEGISTGSDSRFFDECMKREVLYVPGRYCYAQEPGRPKPDNHMRLCYGYIEEEPMKEGLLRLSEAIRAVI